MYDKNKTFENVIIYKLSCKNPSVLPFYIGSTMNLYSRIAHHKHMCKSGTKKRYLYNFIKDFGDFENWKFDILAHHQNKTLAEKKQFEKQFIDMYKPQLNKTVIGRTNKEYMQTFREKINLHNRISHYKHIEKRRKYLKERYQQNKEKYLPMIRASMEKYKDKYKANREFKVNCLCGCSHRWEHRHKHRKTDKHKENMIEIKKEIIDICSKLRSTQKTTPAELE